MMDFGDLPELKELAIRVGSVFKMELTNAEGVSPKHPGEVSRTKYFVVVGIDDDRIAVASVVINSEINSNLFWRIADYQCRITSSEYDFLSKAESYVDCYDIKLILVAKISQKAEYVGYLSQEDLDEILKIVCASPVNKKAVLKKFHLL